ncbi:MAG: c-type cytochrome [Vicinamibacteria bacterium]|jgi:mono/diheme cytochrome c family protein
MTRRRGQYIVAAAALALSVGGWTRVAAQAPPPGIKTAPATALVGIEGKDSYMAYCAVCHGIEGRGNGPAAPALKVPVPDLTTMAKRHGKFDRINVERRISGADQMPVAHGTMTMPIWGPVFRSTGDPPTTVLRVSNLGKYLEDMQVK